MLVLYIQEMPKDNFQGSIRTSQPFMYRLDNNQKSYVQVTSEIKLNSLIKNCIVISDLAYQEFITILLHTYSKTIA